MKIGVVGANGFVGRNICSKFIQRGDRVHAFYNNNISQIPKECILNKGNNINLDALFIAIGNHSYTQNKYLKQFIYLNQLLSKLNFKKIIYISSVSVYGDHPTPIKINSSYNNPSLYGRAKIIEEFLISNFKNYTIIRPSYLYGKSMNRNSLLPIWVDEAEKSKRITLYGDGERKNDYLHIDDFINLCMEIINEKKNNTYIGATGTSISNLEVANLIAQKYHGERVLFKDHPPSPSYEFDVSHTLNKLEWRPRKLLKNEIFNI